MDDGKFFTDGGVAIEFSRLWPKVFFSRGGTTVVKFYFTNSKLRTKYGSTKPGVFSRLPLASFLT